MTRSLSASKELGLIQRTVDLGCTAVVPSIYAVERPVLLRSFDVSRERGHIQKMEALDCTEAVQ